MGDSKVIIDVCTGIKNGGNEGGDPEDPKFPIIMDDNRNYAYLFEDQWPFIWGLRYERPCSDYKERKISINKSNKAEEFTLSLDFIGCRSYQEYWSCYHAGRCSCQCHYAAGGIQ